MSTTVNVVAMEVNGFQRWLDHRREHQLHLSVQEFADRAGMPYSTIRRILKQPIARIPKDEQLQALAKAAGREYEWVRREAYEAWFPDLTLHVEESEDLQILMVVAKKLPPRRRQALIEAARALAENGE